MHFVQFMEFPVLDFGLIDPLDFEPSTYRLYINLNTSARHTKRLCMVLGRATGRGIKIADFMKSNLLTRTKSVLNNFKCRQNFT